MVKNSILILVMLITQIFIPQSAAAETVKPVISVNPNSIQFGNVYVRTSSTPVTVTVTNQGNADLVIYSIGLVGTNPDQFDIVNTDLTQQTLATGESISGQVQFNPTSTGAKIACIRISSNDPCNSSFYVVLRGTGVYNPSLQPEISVSPASIDFGSVYVNTDSTPQTVTVTNTGTANLIITDYPIISGTDSTRFNILSINATSNIVPPGAAISGLVQFHPTSTGHKEAYLRIFSDDADESQVDVPLTGYGTDVLPQPEIEVTPVSLDFGQTEQGQTSATQNVTVSNTGAADLNIGNIIINDGQFAITSGNISGQPLNPNDSANISLAFTPAATGDFTTSLIIYSDDADEPSITIILTGTGTSAYQATIGGTVFSDINSNGSQDPGENGLASANVSLDGTLNVITDAAGEFLFVTDTAGVHVVTETNPAGYRSTTPDQINVNVELGHTYYINFGDTNNTSTATIYGTVFNDINSNGSQDPGENGLPGANVSLDGTGNITTDATGQYLFVTDIAGVHSITEVDPAGYHSTTPNTAVLDVVLGNAYNINFGDASNTAGITVNPTSIDFGAVHQGESSAVQKIVISNTGTAVLTITNLNLNHSQFSLASANISGQTLNPGEWVTIGLIFSPTTTGAMAGILTISSDDPDKSPFDVTLSGTGTEPVNPEIDVTPLSIDFGLIQEESSSLSVTVTVTNSGTGDLILGQLTIVGANIADFSIVSDNVSNRTLDAGQTENVSVKFSPLTAGDKEAEIQIPSNDADEGIVKVSLSGKATAKPQPDIDVTPMSITFYPIKTGQTSTAKLVTIKNTGAANLITGTLTIVGSDPGEFYIYSTNASNKSIPPGGSALAYVRFKPTGIGNFEAALQIPSNDPDIAEQNIHVLLTGTGLGWPDAAISPATIDFGTVQIGLSSAPQTATVRNTGTADLHIGQVVITGKDKIDFKIVNNNATGKTLPPGGTATISVKFRPNSLPGSRSAALVVSTSSTIHYQVATALRGNASPVPYPVVKISPTSINFGQVVIGTQSAPVTVTVSNTGTADLKVSSTTLKGKNINQFTIIDDEVTGQWIAPGTSATFKAIFYPTNTGAKSAYIEMVTNVPHYTYRHIFLSGNGDEVPTPEISVEPDEIDFGNIAAGSSSDTEYVTITNNGTADLDLYQISIEGGDKDHFAILSDNASLQTLEPGDSAMVGIQFQPQSAGFKMAELQVPSNDPLNNIASVVLRGTGEGPNISVYPTDIDYGPVQINTNSTDETITILNDGTEDLTIGTVTLTGANLDQFEITSDTASSQTLAPWESAEVTARFKPTTTGLKEAFIGIPSNDADENPFEVSLRGTGTEGPAIPEIDVTPMSIDFGGVDVGYYSATQNVTVSNTGSGNLLIDNISIDSDEFILASANISGWSLNPGESTNISLIFRPFSAGDKTGHLIILSDDTDENTVTVDLTGKGIIHGADLEITKTDSMDPVKAGDEFTYTVTVKNNGPDDAAGVYVYDYLPSGSNWQVITSSSPIEYISSSASTGTITPYTDEVYWEIGNLASGEEETMDITVKVKPMIFMPASSMNNTAEVYGMEYDPVPENNIDTELTTIRATDLVVTKTVSADIVDEGEPFTWTVTVTNNGTEYATDVAVLDIYPYPIADLISTTTSAGTIVDTPPAWMSSLGIASTANTSYICWDIGDLDAHASATMTITASVDLSVLQPFINLWAIIGPKEPLYPIMNIALALSPMGDTDITNNYDTATNNIRIPLPEADLAITKSDNPDPATRGGTITYTINVTNNGPEDVPNVYALDMWPSEQMILDTVTPSTGTTEQVMPAWFSVFSSLLDEKGYIFWDIGPLDSGASASLIMTTTVNATMPITDNVTNTAIVFGPAVDANKENNIATANTTLTEFTDLAITKTASLDEVIAGDNLTYTITVTNESPITAAGVKVVDTIPDLIEFTGVNPSTGTAEYVPFVSSISGNVTWDIGDLAGGSSATLEINGKVLSMFITASNNITNTATVSGNAADPNPANNTASVITMIRFTDLQIDKTASADAVSPGEEFTWAIIVTNNGPEYATNVTVVDMYMPEFTIIHEITTSTGSLIDEAPEWMQPLSFIFSAGSGTIIWDIGDLDAGASAYMTITASGNFSGYDDSIMDIYSIYGQNIQQLPIINMALVLSPLGESNFNNNYDYVMTMGDIDVPEADLEITKTANPDPATRGGDITYTLNVTNNGPEDVNRAFVLDFWLKDQLTLNTTNPSTGSVFQTIPTNLDKIFGPMIANDTGFIFWEIGPLGNGESATLTMTTTVNATAPLSMPVFNMAAVFGRFLDYNQANNMVYTMTSLAQADLAITKTDSPDPALANRELNYTLTVFNNGPFKAEGVEVTDILPGNVTYQSYTTVTGTVTETAGTVTWDIGDLAAGDNATLTIGTTAPDSTGIIFNNANVTAITEDINLGNNSVSENTTVIPVESADLKISKTDSIDPVAISGELTYTVTVTNNGPLGAAGVKVTDTLPAGVTYQSASATTGTAPHNAGIIEWTIGEMAAGATETLAITVSAPEASGTITNTASVSSDSDDPIPGNNTATEDTLVAAYNDADLQITKTDTPDPVAAGGDLAYTITVINNGPANAEWVYVTDYLPAGVEFKSFLTSTGTPINDAGLVTWSIGDLNAGASANLTIAVKAPVTEMVISNTAIITSETHDPNLGNNTATATTYVYYIPAFANLQITKTASPEPVIAGNTLTYTLTVTNNSPNTATGIAVTDTLPANYVPGSAVTPTGTMVITSNNLTWNIGSLATGASASASLSVTAPLTSGYIVNTATVSGYETDPLPFDNTASVITMVLPDIYPDITVTPTSYDYGAVMEGTTSEPATITVTNDGQSILILGNLTITDSQFVITSGNISGSILLPGESANINITFSPSATGPQTASLSIPSNDPVESTVTVSLSGTGAEMPVPDIHVTPGSIDFGTITIGGQRAETVTVSNTGNGVLSITGLRINSSQFSISSGNISGQTLGPGFSAEIVLVFRPNIGGADSATLTITSNDPDENPATVILTGTGSSSPGPGPGPGPGPTPTPTPTTTTANVSTPTALRYFTVNFLGKVTKELASDDGRPEKRITADDPNGVHLLEIEAGTGAKDANRDTITLIEIREAFSVPTLPPNTVLIGKAYQFMPSGTIFDRSIRLTLGYDVSELPENVISVGTAYYSAAIGWVFLDTEITSVAELGKLTVPVNHFTVFAVLAKVAEPAITPKPTPTPTPVIPEVAALPASFTISNLRIASSISEVFGKVVYFRTTGKEATITVDVTNEGEQSGTYPVTLYLNGEEVETKDITLEAGQVKEVAFTVKTDKAGRYTVQIGELEGEFMRKAWINIWLWVGSIIVLGLLCWYIVYLVKKKTNVMVI